MKPPLHLALPLLAACSAAEARPPIVFDEASLTRHRLEGETIVAVLASAGPPSAEVPVEVTISPQGEVVKARVDPEENREGADPAAALAAARQWTFRPFRYRGEAVAA